MLVSSLPKKPPEKAHETEREGERERGRGVGELSSGGEGGRVLRGGVEPERKRVVQRRILLVTREISAEHRDADDYLTLSSKQLFKLFPNEYKRKNKEE